MRQATIGVTDGDGDPSPSEELFSALGRAGLLDFEVLSWEGARGMFRVELADDVDEERIADCANVADVERVSDGGPRSAYLVEFAPESPPCGRVDEAEEATGGGDHGDDGEGDVLEHRMRAVDDDELLFDLAGSQDAIGETIRRLEAVGADVSLRRLGDYEATGGPLDGLTARQREVLRAAYEAGYFDVPRSASMAEVASDLDLDRSTVSEHLQRAERNLLSRMFSG